jgi:hypothetical protein
MVLLDGLYGGLLYFGISRRDAQAAYEYRGDLTEVAKFLVDYTTTHPDAPRPYLVLDAFSVQTVHYLATVSAHDYESHPDEADHRYRLLDPATSHLTELAPGDIIIFTQSTMPDAARVEAEKRSMPGVELRISSMRYNMFGQEIMRVYEAVSSDSKGSFETGLDA